MADDLDGQLVDHSIGYDRGDIAGSLRCLCRIELQRLLIAELVKIPHHSVGIELRSIVELHPGPELECPHRLILRIHRPRQSEAGLQPCRPIRVAQVPVDQRVIDRDAHEALAFAALAGLSCCQRDVSEGRRDAQHLL
jgi:hypothetical protein